KNPALEEVAEILEEIAQEDYRAGEVIRRLRRLFKKEERQSEPISLNELIISTLRLVQSELVHRNIRVDTELKTNLPPTSGDSVELQQVFLNLIMNALDAMTSTSIRRLSIATRETRDGYVEVSIRDRGPGMSPDELKRVHEPFFTTKQGGLGLGLS